MAERTMLVCDTCGRPAVETVTFKTSAGNRQRDYCSAHLGELVTSSRTPKRGRRPGQASAKRSGAKKRAARKSSGRKKAPARRTSSAPKD